MPSSDSAERLVNSIVEECEDTSPFRNEYDCRVFDEQPKEGYNILTTGLTSDSDLLGPDIEFFGNFPKSVAKNISIWERNHVLNKIDQIDPSSITVDEVTERELYEVHRIVDSPTKIYLPMEEEYHKEFMLSQNGIFSDDIEIEWLASDIDDFDKGFVVSADRIQLSQYTQLPASEKMRLDDVISEYSSFSSDTPIFVEFCRTDDPTEIEVHFGTVVDEEPYYGYNSTGTIQLPSID